MKYLLIICAFSVLYACGEEEVKKKEIAPKEQVLTEIKDGVFKEFYPGTNKVKFEGAQDAEGKRHGIWYFYAENGAQISMTEYRHGLKNGVSYHKFPNGAMQYTGQYKEDVQIGIWKTYDSNGQLKDSINYDELNKKFK